MSRRGFTLVEVILVAIALTMLLTASIPRFHQTAQRLHAEQTAFGFTQLLRYAHERAVADGRATAMVWDADASRASLEIIQEDGQPLLLAERAASSEPVSREISVRVTRDGAPAERVTFFPDGTSEAAIVELAADTFLYTVTVDAATSQVALSKGSPAR